jgi:serine protease AprX
VLGEAWHGTMTSVVCAGDGYLSNGLYKGIASDAELVLIKTQDNAGKITTENIVKALDWVLMNHKNFGIRIVNMSLGDDEAISYKLSEVDKLAEQLVAEGVVIVAAVGNDEAGKIKPPANSPNVIAIGGVDDENRLGLPLSKLYHSSYGETMDGLQKPELLAHAIWIAAPILPGTAEQKESEILHSLLQTTPEKIKSDLKKNIAQTGLDPFVKHQNDITIIREAIIQRIQACKYISPHYMHVDGTSFAAPVVCSVISQMLEANPQLSPAVIREVLFQTAKRIDSIRPERQGFGVIRPRKAIFNILKREVTVKPHLSPYINKRKKSIGFYVYNDCASQISLAGSFNQWAKDVLLMQPGRNGIWKIEIPMLPAGRYSYKFFVDEKIWLEDVDNPYREPDGFSGFNSILLIEN